MKKKSVPFLATPLSATCDQYHKSSSSTGQSSVKGKTQAHTSTYCFFGPGVPL